MEKWEERIIMSLPSLIEFLYALFRQRPLTNVDDFFFYPDCSFSFFKKMSVVHTYLWD